LDPIDFTFTGLTIMHNSTFPHSLPITVADVFRSKYMLLYSNITNKSLETSSLDMLGQYENDSPSAASYIIRNYPFMYESQRSLTFRAIIAVFAALFTLIPFCYLPASFVLFLIKERSSKAKQLQLVSGMRPISYWIGTYIFDMCNYIIVICLVLIVFIIFDVYDFVGTQESIAGTFTLMIMYGLAAVPLAYSLSFFFSNPVSGQVSIAAINFVVGFLLVIASFILDGLEDTRDTNADLKPTFYRLFPPYVFGESLINMSTRSFYRLLLGKHIPAFDWDILGRNLVYLAVEAIFFFFLTLFIEYRVVEVVLYRLKQFFGIKVLDVSIMKVISESSHQPLPFVEDQDVLAEKKRIDNNLTHNDAVVIKHLWKVFKSPLGQQPVIATRDLSLTIPKAVSFGLLGVNGAGKSTLISMLTGEFPPSSGQAFINGHDIVSEMQLIRRQIGVCPQFDALLDLLTAREHLTMIAKLKGMPDNEISSTVEELIHRVGLDKFADQVSSGYSGGSKRKLSLAIALLCTPQVIFLDEPSSGMDVVSRRLMWQVISDVQRNTNASIILTSHHMEEIDAVCSEVAVLVAGHLFCIGSPQHLKTKFADAFFCEFTVDETYVVQLKKFIENSFHGAILEEHQLHRLRYRLPKQSLSLSSIFSIIELHKNDLHIIDYAVSQSSLEQIFVSIAKAHDEAKLAQLKSSSTSSQHHD